MMYKTCSAKPTPHALRRAGHPVTALASRNLPTCWNRPDTAPGSSGHGQGENQARSFPGRAACRAAGLHALGLEAAVTMPGTITSRDTLSDCAGTDRRYLAAHSSPMGQEQSRASAHVASVQGQSASPTACECSTSDNPHQSNWPSQEPCKPLPDADTCHIGQSTYSMAAWVTGRAPDSTARQAAP